MGMVGGGSDAFIGAIHRRAAFMDNQIELVCGCFSVDPEISKSSGLSYFLPEDRIYSTYQEMFEHEMTLPEGERMDFVTIVTPNRWHFEPAMMALERGFHVVVDKPMTFSLEEAKQLLEEHIGAADTRSAELFVTLAALHQMEGQDDLSKAVLLQGIDAFPDDENLLYEYGLMLESSGDHAAALAVMEKIIEIKPDNAAALNFVGYSWAEKKINLDQALDYIQRAIELKPDNGFIRDSLGWVFFRLGKIDQAIKELEAAVRLSPDDPAILDHLGDAYLESGRVRGALQTYKKALKHAMDDEQEKNRIVEKIRIQEKQGSY